MQKLSRMILTTLLFIWGMVVVSSAQEQEALLKFHQSKYQKLMKYFQQAQKTEPLINFDVSFYHLNIDVAIQKPYIKGDVLCRFKSAENSLQEIKLNLLHTFQIDSIIGNVNNYTFSNDTIHISLDKSYQSGSEAEVRIYYQGEPQPTADGVGFQYDMSTGVPKIATLCEPYFSHYWWPCKDGAGDKADSVYIDITIPDTTINGVELIALSNGVLENIISESGKKTFQWRERYPIATYYIMAAVSNYRHLQQSYSGKYGENFFIDYWVFPENIDDVGGFVAALPGVMSFFSDLFGKYPFHKEKYAVTQISSSLPGLENQTNTIWPDNLWQGHYEFLGAVHELAHSWFGCMVSFADLRHVWINEGFANYCAALFDEHENGVDAYKNLIEYYEYYDGGSLYYSDFPEGLWEIFGPLIYCKGAYVLHMLRGVLGDSVFFECLYQYANQPDLMYKHATTEDFEKVCENTSGIDLDFFFTQWIYDEYYPNYEYSFYQNPSTFETLVQIRQTQADDSWRPIFEMPIQLKVMYKDRSDTTVTVWNDEQDQIFSLDLKKQMQHITFDPDKWILKKVKQVLWTDVTDNLTITLPSQYDLLQNYPNPFNPNTTIEFALPKSAFVTLKVYNLLGEEVVTLVEEQRTAGIHKFNWDASGLASGVYLYRLEAGEFVQSKKLVLMR